MDWHRRNLVLLEDDFKRLYWVGKPVTVLESYLYQPSTTCILQRRVLGEQELRAWLQEDVPKIRGTSPVTGMRLMLSLRNSNYENRILHHLPFSKETYKLVCNAFGLHHSFIRTIVRGKSDFSRCQFVHETSRRPLTSYHIRMEDIIPGDIVFSITIDDETGFVNAIIHGCTAQDVDRLFDWLEVLKPELFDPLLLPALVMELIRTKHSEIIEEKIEKLLALSGATRLYDNRPKISLDDVHNYNKRTTENLQVHQDTGDLALTIAQTRVQVLKLLKLVGQEEVARAPGPQRISASRIKQRLEDTVEIYDQLGRTCIQVIQDSNLLMGAIYNLIAQRQNQVNMEIAAESRTISAASKRDNSAMRTIAVVTMVFLPGTFVASFFAMPLLNWQAEAIEDIVSPRFWIYWAVTLPLTITVLVAWGMWLTVTADKTVKDKGQQLN